MAIKINTPKGSSVKTTSPQTYLKGVKQTSTGGEISHKATSSLIQKDNEMIATKKGKIVNEVQDGGELIQENNKMKAEKKGKIVNRVKKKPMIVGPTIAIIGLIADLVTLLTTGKHVWDYVL